MTRLGLAVAVLALLAAACGKDDGGSVREVEGQGSDSGSASGSAAGSASGSASGSATGVGGEEKCEPEGAEMTSDVEVAVVLSEFAIDPAVSTVNAGVIEFELTNEGVDGHEFVIVRGDDAATLPLTDDEVVDLEALDDQDAFIGEVETFPGGQFCEGTFDLTPGPYVLLCNLVETEENGEIENHFKEGMHTTFTVT